MAIETSATEDGFDQLLARLDAATKQAVADASHLVEASIKASFEGSHAKGQPHVGGSAPNVVSGTLRRSVEVVGPVSSGEGMWSAKVGPSVIYGRRVELGFTGTDSLGRRYAQRAYPFVGPGFSKVQQRIEDTFVHAWTDAAGD